MHVHVHIGCPESRRPSVAGASVADHDADSTVHDLPRPHPRASPPASARCWPTATPPRGCPACPDWDAADLLWHLAGVQWFWADGRSAPGRPPARRPRTSRERPATYAELLRAFDELLRRAGRRARAADPAEPAWTWSPRADRRLHLPPPGPRGADPPARRRADRRAGARRSTRRSPPTASPRRSTVMFGGCPRVGHVRRRSPTTCGVDLTDTGDVAVGAARPLQRHRPRQRQELDDEPDIARGRRPRRRAGRRGRRPAGDARRLAVAARGDDADITVDRRPRRSYDRVPGAVNQPID